MELNSVILTIGSSVGFFKLVNYGIGKLPIPETAQRNAWKWKNISTSFVHSLITGVWSVLCFCMHPQMAEDLIETYSVFSHALVSLSIGYFIYDFFDMVINQKISHSWELLFHHVVNLIIQLCCVKPAAFPDWFKLLYFGKSCQYHECPPVHSSLITSCGPKAIGICALFLTELQYSSHAAQMGLLAKHSK
ncbi:TLC domain-containing protein 2 [Anabarilius grahami]|uniref:TLC domain-containing protein 2 n=1 Tax=Anabarilius grahami TaxID=495550 RepID=A0A3N0XYI2_ANAGA|nr:TLC domain-containing protein 2 [Anabarilius grahami]